MTMLNQESTACVTERATAQPAEARHAIFVCTTCKSTWKNGQRVGTSGGERLYERLRHALQASAIAATVDLNPVNCMSACSQHCTVAFSGPGKSSYLFGGIDGAGDGIDAGIAAVLTCAEQYCDREDGQLPWAERPEPLKGGLVAKIPPIGGAAIAR